MLVDWLFCLESVLIGHTLYETELINFSSYRQWKEVKSLTYLYNAYQGLFAAGCKIGKRKHLLKTQTDVQKRSATII